jgi:ketosteroid isomerase-like protein
MSEENKRVVLQFMEAMGTSNAELAEPCLAPDACAIAKGYGRLAGRREAATMTGMIEAFKALLPTGLNFTIHRVIADGDSVAVEAEGDGMTSTGVPYRNQYCFVFTLEGGKIKQVNEYFCTIHADEVLWPLVEQLQSVPGAVAES